ncbi:MAG: tail fiber domain-containing protein [bacterium]|nr:tail fiber domain-containing protein [bacterium]
MQKWWRNLGFISDERVKKDIQDLDTKEALEKMLLLSPKTFKWINPAEHQDQTEDIAGVMAQNLESVFPDCVVSLPIDSDKADYNLVDGEAKNVSYTNSFTAFIIASIQELNKKIDANIKMDNREKSGYKDQLDLKVGKNIKELPNDYKGLDKDAIVYVVPFKHFGSGWGEVKDNQLELHVSQAGTYNVLVFADSKDELL